MTLCGVSSRCAAYGPTSRTVKDEGPHEGSLPSPSHSDSEIGVFNFTDLTAHSSLFELFAKAFRYLA